MKRSSLRKRKKEREGKDKDRALNARELELNHERAMGEFELEASRISAGVPRDITLNQSSASSRVDREQE